MPYFYFKKMSQKITTVGNFVLMEDASKSQTPRLTCGAAEMERNTLVY